MTTNLKIAIIADPEIPVPPLHYGGIERIIDMLIKGLLSKGHSVSLFAHRDSVSEADFYPFPAANFSDTTGFLKNAWLINKTILQNKYDVVHSFGRLLNLLPLLPLSIPKIMSYQREPTLSQIKKAVKLAKKNTLSFTGCSDYITSQIKPFAAAQTIYNGVDLNTYLYKERVEPDAPLVFLGRIEPIKGTHIAVQAALKTNKKLIIAGNIPAGQQEYFDNQIRPFLSEKIGFVGSVNDIQKNELLGQAAAFLMPIEWNEPFGIVMAEAMACGTPVIGYKRGAVPEVVVNNHNGFAVNDFTSLCDSILNVSSIRRENVRKRVEEKFSSDVIIEQYLNLYLSKLKEL